MDGRVDPRFLLGIMELLHVPKWVYFVPFVDFAHIFEMPLLGYLGYLPFFRYFSASSSFPGVKLSQNSLGG